MKNIIGNKYGKLLVLDMSGTRKYFCKCICDCGTEKEIYLYSLSNGYTTSCGCLWSKLSRDGNLHKTHGKTYSNEYITYHSMIGRCYDNKDKEYNNYGGRGIRVCDRWKDSFENFYYDMNDKPSPKYSLERKDVNSYYCKDNCYWATAKQQSNNRRNTIYINYNGKEWPLSELAEAVGIKRATLRDRIVRYGMTVEEAVTTPVRKRKEH